MKISPILLLPLCCSLMVGLNAAPRDKDSGKSKTAQKKDTGDKKKEEAAPKPQPQTVDADSNLGRMAMAVKNYYSAKSPKEKLAFVLDPEKTEPLMRDYYFREGLIPGSLTQMTTPEAVALNGNTYWKTNVVLTDGRQSTVFMKLVDEKTPKIDWPSEVKYSVTGWDEWMTKNDSAPVDFRVLAQVDNFYPETVNDRSKYLCIKLKHANSANTIFAYLNLKDADQLDFAQKIANGQATDCVLTLKLLKPQGDIQMALVDKVVSPSWVITETRN